MWSAATKWPCHDDITHVLPLRLRDLSGRTPSRSHHHAMRSGMTLPCVQITGVPSAAAISRTRRRAALRSSAYASSVSSGSLWIGDAEFFGQRLDGLVAAHPVGGVERVGAEREQLADQRFGLSAAAFVQRALPVVALVPGLAACGAVPNDQNGLGVGRQLGEPAQHLAVVRISELLRSRPQRAATSTRRLRSSA